MALLQQRPNILKSLLVWVIYTCRRQRTATLVPPPHLSPQRDNVQTCEMHSETESATRCNTLQHIATHVQHTSTYCTATHTTEGQRLSCVRDDYVYIKLCKYIYGYKCITLCCSAVVYVHSKLDTCIAKSMKRVSAYVHIHTCIYMCISQLDMCVYVYMYIHSEIDRKGVYMYIYIHIYVYVNIHVFIIYAYIYVCIYVYMCVYMYVYIYIYVYIYTYTQMHMYMYINIHICMYLYVCICVYVYLYMYI